MHHRPVARHDHPRVEGQQGIHHAGPRFRVGIECKRNGRDDQITGGDDAPSRQVHDQISAGVAVAEPEDVDPLAALAQRHPPAHRVGRGDGTEPGSLCQVLPNDIDGAGDGGALQRRGRRAVDP